MKFSITTPNEQTMLEAVKRQNVGEVVKPLLKNLKALDGESVCMSFNMNDDENKHLSFRLSKE